MRYLLILLLIISVNYCFGQNLVPNPSFELYNPNFTGFQNWEVAGESPDAFCSGLMNAPTNIFGYQYPNSGVSYAGLMSYERLYPYFREIWRVKLSDSLHIGNKYYASMKVSRADKFNCATNKIGLFFSNTPHFYSNVYLNNSKVFAINKIADSINWTTIKGSFFADSNYRYLYVGNLFDNSSIDTTLLWTLLEGGFHDCETYFYIDDICISIDSVSCEIAENQVNKLDNLEIGSNFIYPNPISNFVYFKAPPLMTNNIIIINEMGHEIYSGQPPKEIDVSNWPNGMYIFKLQTYSEVIVNKLLIQH